MFRRTDLYGKNTMTDKLTQPFVALSGGRPDILAAVPGARTKFVAMGAVITATAVIAALSAAFAAGMALNAPTPVAVVIGILWGLVILVIDRALVVQLGHCASPVKMIGIAVPRVALALILGSVISTPLTLQIFHRETAAEIRTIQREAADQFSLDLANDDRFKEIPALQEQAEVSRQRVASNGASDPEVQAKRAAYDAAQAENLRLHAEAQCELNGHCGTGRAGIGDAYDAAKAAADRQQEVTDAAKRDLDAAAASSRSQGEITLRQAEERLSKLRGERQVLQQEFDERNSDNTGLLMRLHALDRIGDRDAMLHWAHLLLWAMFTCIELLPVLVKLTMSLGPATAYDRAQDLQDNGDAAVFEQQIQSWRDAQQLRARLGVDIENDKVDVERQRAALAGEIERDRITREKDQGIRINEKVVQTQTEVVENTLAVWARHARLQAQDQLDEYERRLEAERMAAKAQHKNGAPSAGTRNGKVTNTYIHASQLPDGTVL